MQLVAYGAQDIYLTGNPQITFFKVVYRRHTNFSMEAIEQTWNGSSTASGRCTATISRNGDLVGRMYLDIKGTTKNDTGNPGCGWIKTVDVEIGGQRVDRHSGLFMEAYAELTEPNDAGRTVQLASWNATTAGQTCGTKFQTMSGMGGVHEAATNVTAASHFYVPLQFWFCRNPGLALPLIALQYHEVKVILEHTIATFYTSVTNKLFCDYIYLDTDERRRFAQVSHEYLIEQVQEQSLTAGSGSVELNFNHPVKELIWTAGTGAAGAVNSCELLSIDVTLTDTFSLKLNGHERFAPRALTYFGRTQVWQHHTGPGGLNSTSVNVTLMSNLNTSIGVYSFALKPEEHQPSGTCNFSRIDNAQFYNADGGTIVANAFIFAINYNVLRVMSGMGGLAYSN